MVQYIGLIPHGDSLSSFSFQPVLHDWYNKGCSMCYPVCEMVHIKEPLLLIGKSIGGSRFPLSPSGLLPYVQHRLTINKMCWVCCKIKHFLPSFTKTCILWNTGRCRLLQMILSIIYFLFLKLPQKTQLMFMHTFEHNLFCLVCMCVCGGGGGGVYCFFCVSILYRLGDLFGVYVFVFL